MSSLPVRWRVFALVFVSLALVATASASVCGQDLANSGCAPLVTANVNGQNYNVSANTFSFTDGHWVLSYAAQSYGNFVMMGGNLTSESDPFITFSWGVSNPGNSDMPFSFDVVAPYTGGPYQLAESIFGDTLLHEQGQGGNSTVMGDLAGGFIMQAFVDGNLVASLGTGCTATPSQPCNSPGPYLVDTNYTSASSGMMELVFSFTLSPHSDYSWNGQTELFLTPEPGTLMLLGSGVVGLAGLLRRKI